MTWKIEKGVFSMISSICSRGGNDSLCNSMREASFSACFPYMFSQLTNESEKLLPDCLVARGLTTLVLSHLALLCLYYSSLGGLNKLRYVEPSLVMIHFCVKKFIFCQALKFLLLEINLWIYARNSLLHKAKKFASQLGASQLRESTVENYLSLMMTEICHFSSPMNNWLTGLQYPISEDRFVPCFSPFVWPISHLLDWQTFLHFKNFMGWWLCFSSPPWCDSSDYFSLLDWVIRLELINRDSLHLNHKS